MNILLYIMKYCIIYHSFMCKEYQKQKIYEGKEEDEDASLYIGLLL